VALHAPGLEAESPLQTLQRTPDPEALSQAVDPDEQALDGVVIALPAKEDLIDPAQHPSSGVVDAATD
jgi:hypothetical protein